jgi:hypothetical protein
MSARLLLASTPLLHSLYTLPHALLTTLDAVSVAAATAKQGSPATPFFFHELLTGYMWLGMQSDVDAHKQEWLYLELDMWDSHAGFRFERGMLMGPVLSGLRDAVAPRVDVLLKAVHGYARPYARTATLRRAVYHAATLYRAAESCFCSVFLTSNMSKI